MRLTRALAAGVFLAVAAAACGSGSGPGWTYAPAPSSTPVPSGAPSGSPPASASPAASAPAGATVTVVATTPLQFDTPELEVAADQPFTLEFDNQDPTVQHNVVIHNPDGSKVEMGDTTPFIGPATRTYEVPALAAGEYPFNCEVHPAAMTGTLTVK